LDIHSLSDPSIIFLFLKNPTPWKLRANVEQIQATNESQLTIELPHVVASPTQAATIIISSIFLCTKMVSSGLFQGLFIRHLTKYYNLTQHSMNGHNIYFILDDSKI